MVLQGGYLQLGGGTYRDDGLAVIQGLDIHPEPAILLDQVHLQVLLLPVPSGQTLVKDLHPVTPNVHDVAIKNEVEK